MESVVHITPGRNVVLVSSVGEPGLGVYRLIVRSMTSRHQVQVVLAPYLFSDGAAETRIVEALDDALHLMDQMLR